MVNRHRALLFDLFDTLCRIDETVYRQGKAEAARLLGLPLPSFLSAWIAAGDLAQTGVLPDVAARVRHTTSALGAPAPDASTIAQVVRVEESTLFAATSLYPDALPALAAVHSPP